MSRKKRRRRDTNQHAAARGGLDEAAKNTEGTTQTSTRPPGEGLDEAAKSAEGATQNSLGRRREKVRFA